MSKWSHGRGPSLRKNPEKNPKPKPLERKKNKCPALSSFLIFILAHITNFLLWLGPFIPHFNPSTKAPSLNYSIVSNFISTSTWRTCLQFTRALLVVVVQSWLAVIKRLLVLYYYSQLSRWRLIFFQICPLIVLQVLGYMQWILWQHNFNCGGSYDLGLYNGLINFSTISYSIFSSKTYKTFKKQGINRLRVVH